MKRWRSQNYITQKDEREKRRDALGAQDKIRAQRRVRLTYPNTQFSMIAPPKLKYLSNSHINFNSNQSHTKIKPSIHILLHNSYSYESHHRRTPRCAETLRPQGIPVFQLFGRKKRFHGLRVGLGNLLMGNVRKCGMANSPTSRDSAVVAWQEIWSHRISSL